MPLACLAAGPSVPAAPDLRLGLSARGETGDAAPLAGTPLILELTANNDGEAPLVLDFPDGQRFDFEVFSEDGTSVWRWSEGMFFARMIGRETLEPEASLNWIARIENGLDEGTYAIVATLTTMDQESVDMTLTLKEIEIN